MKKRSIIISILVASFFAVIFLFVVFSSNDKEQMKEVNIIEEKNIQEVEINKVIPKEQTGFCYYYLNKTTQGLYNKSWLRLNIDGKKVTGEFNIYPVNKPSKTGFFEGTVKIPDKETEETKYSLWWNSFIEGIKTKEELLIKTKNNDAMIMYGEMIDRGDGVYIYKDKFKLSYVQMLKKVPCENIDEIITIEKYIKDNINAIRKDKPLIGGFWRIIGIAIDPNLNSGEIISDSADSLEIQSIATFLYDYDVNTKNIVITKFIVQK